MENKRIDFAPGSLVKIRGREWVLEPCSINGCIKLRPLGGTDSDVQILMPSIETSELESANFPLPDINNPGSYSSALLLRNALRLKFTNGAGPFRALGHIAVEPRPYQLVPLLMALKMQTVRLLIADDVGIGKTIEAGLILKELLERGEISKFVVLCPPHLVEQWVSELSIHFNIDAVGVTAKTISKLEKEVPQTQTFFEYYPASVISLDYIKADAHSDWFKNHIEDSMIIVDEAHTCCVGGGKQLRYNLLKSLADNQQRNMLLLTATPHSGDENAFSNLVSLLNPEFKNLYDDTTINIEEKNSLRKKLSLHFVQRRRTDIKEYSKTDLFPERKTTELTYNLTGEWGTFFDEVRKYCVKMAQQSEKEKGQKGQMMWYATLALLRCVSSSPEAAFSALSTRFENLSTIQNDELLKESIAETLDGSEDSSQMIEELLNPGLENSEEVKILLDKAKELKGSKNDPKLKKLVDHIKEMYSLHKKEDDNYRPVIFCKYIATAHYLAEELKNELSNSSVTYVTGEFTSEEREAKVFELTKDKNPILVATDCLSEGINLQEGFNAIIHYDLAWNPTRHEQREGRVDRFGQRSKNVWCTMLYGNDNPVDGFIFNVIIRKARAIKNELGILVPVPDDDCSMRLAIVKAALLKDKVVNSNNSEPMLFDIDELDELTQKTIEKTELKWNNALEKEKKNRTIFAQNSLKPEEVIPEWQKAKNALGDSKDVERFVSETCNRLNSGITKKDEHSYVLDVSTLPTEIQKEIMPLADKNKAINVSFEYPAKQGYSFITRSNNLVSSFASYMLENALNSNSSSIATRCGTYISNAVQEITTIYLLRIRYQIKSNSNKKILIAEESVAFGVEGRTNPKIIEDDNVEKLLNSEPEGNLSSSVITKQIETSIEFYKQNQEFFNSYAQKRADILAQDHTRVRTASNLTSSVKVEPNLPPDIIGVYVLLPNEEL